MNIYFVTGATGAIGSALIPILLKNPENRVVMLLRARSPDELQARVEELYRFWQIAPADQESRSRVRALAGDVTCPEFGLDQSNYRQLCAECTHVVHSAGNVRMNLPIEEARRSSLDSARNIIALAHAGRRIAKIEFVSTVGVGGRIDGTVPESWIDSSRLFHNTYEQAKAEAEDILRVEIGHGLPVTVHRPSMVVGDTVSGRIIHFQVFYHLCEFLSGKRTFGLAPDFGRARLDIIPADYVARLIAWSSSNSATSGCILHSCSGPEHALPLVFLHDAVRKAFSEAGKRLPPAITLPAGVFRRAIAAAALFMPPEMKRAVKTLPVFLDYLATEQTFANQRTQALAGAAGLPLPDPNVYLRKVLAYYLRTSART